MKLDIVMYHYVRPISKSRYPKIKGLELEAFKKQLDFFLKEKNLVTDSVCSYLPFRLKILGYLFAKK